VEVERRERKLAESAEQLGFFVGSQKIRRIDKPVWQSNRVIPEERHAGLVRASGAWLVLVYRRTRLQARPLGHSAFRFNGQ
jgi:hypothetical protein